MLKTWIERWPERLDYELEALRTAGIPFQRDEEAWGNGVLRLRLSPTVYGEIVSLIAEFPDFYPYARFEVSAPELDLPHHQNPFEKYLCLLGRSSEHWNVSDTLADVLTEQLPKLLKSAESDNPDIYRDLEEEQAEPITTYYGYHADAIILVDGRGSQPMSTET